MTSVCLITGSAGKLGSALCLALAGTHRIVAVYRNSLPAITSQLRTALQLGHAREQPEPTEVPFCVQGDLTRSEDRRRIVEVALARFGQIDVIVNSAADTRFHGKLLELSFDSSAVETQLLTNCVAPLQLVSDVFQQSWKHDREASRRLNRCVVNVSSISGLRVFPSVGQAFYGASKAAFNFLTQYLASELLDYGVRANAICPARFPDSIPTEKVVSRVMSLMESHVTGQVIEITRES